MRDTETVKAALAASETGHFVMSTLHTTDAQETINRIIDFFPPHEQKQVRLSLAGALRGIICQRLVPARRRPGPLRRDGDLRQHRPRRRRDRRPGQDLDDRPADRARARYYGMQTFDQHLVALIRDGVITLEAAMARLDEPARPHGRAAPPRPRRLTARLDRRLSRRLAVLDAPRRPAARQSPAPPSAAGTAGSSAAARARVAAHSRSWSPTRRVRAALVAERHGGHGSRSST